MCDNGAQLEQLFEAADNGHTNLADPDEVMAVAATAGFADGARATAQ